MRPATQGRRSGAGRWLRRLVRIAVALAQIGEFSFIVAALGNQLGLVTPDVRNTLIATAIVSIALNPLLYRAVAPIERRFPSRRTKRELEPWVKRGVAYARSLPPKR